MKLGLASRLINLIPLLLLLGTGVMMFFLILCGGTERSVMKHFYWLEADTKGYSGAQFDRTRWTNYNICEGSSGSNKECTKTKPAYPFSPKDNFKSSQGLPSTFVKKRKTYYYLSRIGWALLLIGLAMLLLSLLLSALSICLGVIALPAINALVLGMALFFTLTAACLLTAAYVKGRNAFKDDGKYAHLGVKMFGLLWASVAALMLSFMAVCTSGICMGASKYKQRKQARDDESESNYYNREPVAAPAAGGAAVGADGTPRTGGIRFFRVSRNEKPVSDGYATTSDEHDLADDHTAVRDDSSYAHKLANEV